MRLAAQRWSRVISGWCLPHTSTWVSRELPWHLQHDSMVARCRQVYLNKVNERCFARIACKLELMEPCSRSVLLRRSACGPPDTCFLIHASRIVEMFHAALVTSLCHVHREGLHSCAFEHDQARASLKCSVPCAA
jgi:hypothetical protein